MCQMSFSPPKLADIIYNDAIEPYESKKEKNLRVHSKNTQ